MDNSGIACFSDAQSTTTNSNDRMQLFKQRLGLYEEQQRQLCQISIKPKLKIKFSDIKANVNNDCPEFRVAVEQKLKQRQLRRSHIRMRKVQTKQWKEALIDRQRKLHEQIDEQLKFEHEAIRVAAEKAETVERIKKLLREAKQKNHHVNFADEEQALDNFIRNDDIVYDEWHRTLFGTENMINKDNPVLAAEHNFDELTRIR